MCVRTVDWGLAGQIVEETGTRSFCDAASCVKTHRSTLQESQHTEREKEGVRKKQKMLSHIQAFSLLLMEHRELMQYILTVI